MVALYIRWLLHVAPHSILFVTLMLLPVSARMGRPTGESPAPFPCAAPLFIQNVGQFDPNVRFIARSDWGITWLAQDAVWVTLTQDALAEQPNAQPGRREAAGIWPGSDRNAGATSARVNLKLTFPGANSRPRLEPFNRQATRVSYLKGNDPTRWQVESPVWAGVRYQDIYPGVDLEIAGKNGQWSWRLTSRDASSLASVRLKVEGADALTVEEGGLIVHTALGVHTLPLLLVSAPDDARLPHPTVSGDEIVFPFTRLNVSHSTSEIGNRPLSDGPHLRPFGSANQSLAVQGQRDLVYATYLGGYFYDHSYALAVDGAGSAYLVGTTQSPDFPTTPGAVGEFFSGGDYDVFVAKMNGSGSALVYATFLGGIGDDWGNDFGRGIAVDGGGNAYVTGWTGSRQFPVTAGALDTTFNGKEDAFVVKLNATGAALVYATLFGGSKFDRGIGLAVDAAGSAYITGWTDSTDLPAVAADSGYNTFQGGSADAFVAKLNSAGSALEYAMFVGGSDQDAGLSIAVNSQGYACLTGLTQSDDFPWRLAIDATLDGMADAFVSCVRPGGGSLFYSTYLGGSENEIGWAIAADASGNVYVTGETNSTDFPVTSGAAGAAYGGGNKDSFVAKISPSDRLVYASYLGQDTDDGGYAIAADSAGDAYVTGMFGDMGVVMFDATGSITTSLLADDSFKTTSVGTGIAVDASGEVFVSVYGASGSLPVTPSAFDPTGDDIWLARIGNPSTITGRVTEHGTQPLAGIQISAGSSYSATTDANGQYTLTVPAGTFSLIPSSGYFWTPAERIIIVPPSVSHQDFDGAHIQKQVTPGGMALARYGDILTYTVSLVYPADGAYALSDQAPTYTTYVSGSLTGPAGTSYDAETNTVNGVWNLTAYTPLTMTFGAQVQVNGTAGLAPRITNRARVCATGSFLTGCEWSNQVMSYTYLQFVYLPLIWR